MTSLEKRRLLARFNPNCSAQTTSMPEPPEEIRTRVPEDYMCFLRETNGGEGFVGDNYIILWTIEDLLVLNRSYMVDEYAPGLFLFGTDGGGEGFAFDTRSEARPIVSVPFVGMDLSLIRPIAPSFDEFLQALYKGLWG